MDANDVGKEVQLVTLGQPEVFSRTELDIIAIHFTDPTVRKYLNFLLLGNITEAANIPLPQLALEPQAYIAKQAFMKGAIGCLHDLLSIEKATQPPNKE